MCMTENKLLFSYLHFEWDSHLILLRRSRLFLIRIVFLWRWMSIEYACKLRVFDAGKILEIKKQQHNR